MFSKRIFRVCFVLALGLVVAGMSARDANAAFTFHSCTVHTVQFVNSSTTPGGERVAVRCQAAAPGGIFWFAIKYSNDPEMAKMVLSAALAAKVGGRPVTVGFESTASGAAWGCALSDCRPLRQIQVQ